VCCITGSKPDSVQHIVTMKNIAAFMSNAPDYVVDEFLG
jgi:hypothetical protein